MSRISKSTFFFPKPVVIFQWWLHITYQLRKMKINFKNFNLIFLKKFLIILKERRKGKLGIARRKERNLNVWEKNLGLGLILYY